MTFLGHEAGQSAVSKGLKGTKWLEVPYLGPPVAPQSRYAGHPMTRCSTWLGVGVRVGIRG